MTTAVIVHQIAGRIRMRIQEMRGNHQYFIDLADRLKNVETIEAVKVNLATLSVVVQFSGSLEELVARMRELDLNMTVKKSDREAVRSSGIRPLRIVSGRNINPMFMLGSTFAVIGLVQTFRGKVAVPSLTALWYAVEAFRNAGKNR